MMQSWHMTEMGDDGTMVGCCYSRVLELGSVIHIEA